MKSPAFSFYPRDWLCSRIIPKLHTHGGRGVSAYMYLLCESWLEIPPATLPADHHQLATLARVSLDEFEELWPILKDAFEPLEYSDRIYSPRLLQEYEKQQNRRNRGSAGGRQRQANRVAEGVANYVANRDSATPLANHLANTSPKTKTKTKTKSKREDEKGKKTGVNGEESLC